jgi:hypothetical protein
MARGGRREGAGRPKGCKDKKPRLSVKALVDMSRAEQIKRGGVLPLAYMLKVMNDKKSSRPIGSIGCRSRRAPGCILTRISIRTASRATGPVRRLRFSTEGVRMPQLEYPSQERS